MNVEEGVPFTAIREGKSRKVDPETCSDSLETKEEKMHEVYLFSICFLVFVHFFSLLGSL